MARAPLEPVGDGGRDGAGDGSRRRPERDGRGRFLAGNRCGRGAPLRARVAWLRVALVDAIGPEDLAAVVAVLLERAKGGDVAACRELLDRAIGKPGAGLDLTPGPDAVPAETVRAVFQRVADFIGRRMGAEAAEALWAELGARMGFLADDDSEPGP